MKYKVYVYDHNSQLVNQWPSSDLTPQQKIKDYITNSRKYNNCVVSVKKSKEDDDGICNYSVFFIKLPEHFGERVVFTNSNTAVYQEAREITKAKLLKNIRITSNFLSKKLDKLDMDNLTSTPMDTGYSLELTLRECNWSKLEVTDDDILITPCIEDSRHSNPFRKLKYHFQTWLKEVEDELAYASLVGAQSKMLPNSYMDMLIEKLIDKSNTTCGTCLQIRFNLNTSTDFPKCCWVCSGALLFDRTKLNLK
ncbi:hypothetical protein COEREDRAFT_89547 [Coemansia reversa NRRL 1564]|uniref:Uncharacterized protein n=1 Tax=Coemansia reversa (strain ATCC 12441 / NRRL 1564) TaxID=763665 RepID=A0A2G5B3C2_COERN|nr:hypothetical protein COEREDRAFT_89547 [Coemansia reversa NRRL 1564]|eukprot:PIA13495.1 hypothetical protein COEREDRAFT_89547 [Coemansia reversa NRRL 1564]